MVKISNVDSSKCCFYSRMTELHLNSIDVSSPHTADRGLSWAEGKTEIVATNRSHVNKPADQWELGGKDAILMPTPNPT